MYVKNKEDKLAYFDKYAIGDSAYLSESIVLQAYKDLQSLTPSYCPLFVNFRPLNEATIPRILYGVRRSYLFIHKQTTIKNDRHNWRGLKNLIEDQGIRRYQRGWGKHRYNPKRYISAIECHVACLIHPQLRLMLIDDCRQQCVYWTVTNLSERLRFVDLDQEMAKLYKPDDANYVWSN